MPSVSIRKGFDSAGCCFYDELRHLQSPLAGENSCQLLFLSTGIMAVLLVGTMFSTRQLSEQIDSLQQKKSLSTWFTGKSVHRMFSFPRL